MVTTPVNPLLLNPYLQDNFAPVEQEITADNLAVIGELPPDLSGLLVRNGPNPQFTPAGSQYLWFDGDGMLHGVRIKNGKASYYNRYVRTKGFQLERQAGRALWGSLMEAPRPDTPPNNPFGPFKNTANTALTWHAGRFLALWEAGEPYEIAVPNLETIGPYTYAGKLSSSLTGHPKIDPQTGEMLFFGYSLTVAPHLKYSIVSPQGELLQTVPIEIPRGVMMHDFAITPNYTIFMDLPLTFSFERVHRGEPAYLFEGDLPGRFGIVPRYGNNSHVRWFETNPCYVLHVLNAYEMGEEIVLIACRMDNTRFLNIPTKFPQHGSGVPYLYCWRFNLRTGQVSETALDQMSSEFPSLNRQWVGRPNRYGYASKMAASDRGPLFIQDGLIKYDFAQSRSEVYPFGLGRYGGEAVFVPRPHAIAEDDGWLLTFVYDALRRSSELVIVNARDVSAGAIARILIPQRVPFGFHGLWLPETLLSLSRNA